MSSRPQRRSRAASWGGAVGASGSSVDAAGSTGGSTGANNNGSTFPRKLAEMLANEQPHHIGWTHHGLSFLIADTEALTHELLPKYFRHNKLTSFQRQLNLYGFRRITKGPDTGAYFHPQFRRDRPDLVAKIRRLPGQGATATAKFLPLYYKDVQNSQASSSSSSPKAGGPHGGKGGGGHGHGHRVFRSESIASTLSHSSSEASFAGESIGSGGDGSHSSAGAGCCCGEAALYGGSSGGGGAHAAHCAYGAGAYGHFSGDESFAGDGEEDLFIPSCLGAGGNGGGGSCRPGEACQGDECECEYSFIDPPPLPSMVSTAGSSALSIDGDDAVVGSGSGASAMEGVVRAVSLPLQEQQQQQQEGEQAAVAAASSASQPAPARFQQTYWQPAPSSASSTPSPRVHQQQAQQALPAAPAPMVRSYTPLPPVAATSSGSSTTSGSGSATVTAAPPSKLHQVFSASSFSQWLNGCNISTPTAAAASQPQQQAQQQQPQPAAWEPQALSLQLPQPPPPPPRPLVKRCSSMNSELWRGWGSTDDLTALAELDPSDMDEIFGSFGRDTETVLHSVGLELASDGSLRPDATSAAANANAVGPHLALSITAA